MTVEIKLTRGFVAIIDKEDYESVRQFKWRVTEAYNDTFYATTWMRIKGKGRHVYLHRFLMQSPKNKKVSFNNGNSLDCRRENLSILTNSERQLKSRLGKNNSTGYRGVSFNKAAGKYKAYIKKDKKLLYLGLFETAEEAAQTYNEKAKRLFGKFARLNEIKA